MTEPFGLENVTTTTLGHLRIIRTGEVRRNQLGKAHNSDVNELLVLPSHDLRHPTKMAAVNALRQMYIRLGFTNAMAGYIITTQGIDTIEELRNLDEAAVKGLCQALKKPGGTIPNPNAGAPGAPAEINNPGFNVSIKAEENLKLAVYFIRHQFRVSRPVVVGVITSDSVRALKDLKAAEEGHTEPTEKPVINADNWPRTLDEVEEYLRNNLGQTKIPLAYIVRKEEDVPPHAGDPAADYGIVQDELIARAPHRDAAGNRTELYNNDNHRVWTLLVGLCRSHLCWTYIKGFARARDGRAAFLMLRSHYLGINNVNGLASKAENAFYRLMYSKETKRFNFETYVSGHKEQHQILEELEIEYDYKGMDEGTKVRHLIAGIKTDKLDTIKGQILGDPSLQRDFDGCVNLFKAFLEQVTNDRSQTFNVSRVATTGEGGNRKTTVHRNKKWVRQGGGSKGGVKRKAPDDDVDAEIKDRYYTPKEYSSFTPAQKSKLQKMREGRSGEQAASTTLTTELQRLTVAVAELKAAQEGNDDHADSDSTPRAGGNRSNPALQRKKTKQS